MPKSHQIKNFQNRWFWHFLTHSKNPFSTCKTDFSESLKSSFAAVSVFFCVKKWVFLAVCKWFPEFYGKLMKSHKLTKNEPPFFPKWQFLRQNRIAFFQKWPFLTKKWCVTRRTIVFPEKKPPIFVCLRFDSSLKGEKWILFMRKMSL